MVHLRRLWARVWSLQPGMLSQLRQFAAFERLWYQNAAKQVAYWNITVVQ